MPYEFYRALHFLGIFLVMTSLGGLLIHVANGGDKDSHRARKLTSIGHGVGMVLVLVAGFGMLARLGLPASSPWVLGKVVVWVVFGALIAIPFRMPKLSQPLWILLPVLGFVAGYLALHKPG
ncbi:MAG: hypothetical protein AAF533_22735 [Acidobacteriota bacterium]